MKIGDVHVHVQVKDLLTQGEVIQALTLVTTVFKVPILGTLEIDVHEKTRFVDERNDFPGKEMSPAEVIAHLQSCPPDGFWILVTGELMILGKGESEGLPIAAMKMDGTAQLLPWTWIVDAERIHFIGLDSVIIQ